MNWHAFFNFIGIGIAAFAVFGTWAALVGWMSKRLPPAVLCVILLGVPLLAFAVLTGLTA